MALRINASKAVELSGYNGQFKESLKDVIKWGSADSKITNIKELAYILATAKIESKYSLQRWEADFVCEGEGIPYKNKPCNSALNYYRSTVDKKDYYTLGVDPRGLPYFGRGLIQLTGLANYKAYGKVLGLDLVSKPDLALKPKNSYKIAVAYMIRRGTFKKVNEGKLSEARRTIGSGGKTAEVTQAYHKWVKILQESKQTGFFSSLGHSIKEKTQSSNAKQIIAIGVSVVVVGIAIFAISKAKNK